MALTAKDLTSITNAVDRSIAIAVPKAMRAEFLKLGLATEDDDDQIKAQRDFAFLRKARQASETMEGMIGRKIFMIVLTMVGLVVIVGFGALLRGGWLAPLPPLAP